MVNAEIARNLALPLLRQRGDAPQGNKDDPGCLDLVCEDSWLVCQDCGGNTQSGKASGDVD
jgi:hypothetical protein